MASKAPQYRENPQSSIIAEAGESASDDGWTVQPNTNESRMSDHSTHSVLREKIAEHLLIGEMLRRLWQYGVMDTEVLRSEFDAGGYDLVLSRRRIVRHIQLKIKTIGGPTARVNVSVKLAERPSGCVVCMVVTPRLEIGSFLWFGGMPGSPLPDLSAMGIARHTKGNAAGVKAERPNHRSVPLKHFEHLPNLDDLLLRLLGPISV